MSDCDGGGDAGAVDDLYEVYSFNKSTGRVTLNTLMATNSPLAVSSGANCMAGRTDANTDGFQDGEESTASFRFVGGALELDLSGSDIFEVSRGSESGAGADPAGTICNNATFPATGTCESYYEKFEL